MVQCVTSYPTSELLNDLYNMDMSAQLDFWASDNNVVGMYNHDTKRILTFLMWLREKSHPDHDHEGDLFYHHLPAIDAWVQSQLDDPDSDSATQILESGIKRAISKSQLRVFRRKNHCSWNL
ncbi:hypothetical protein M413DRAFT_381380 [Hebeloma cylindrosporum]|uniref:Uncharacterized protein n=1 Tax=Hebeloma cylindrosporum TaxID=76867 RepID=A0A0C3CH23_HEBCY|nr:hypothetical protein M413DRAFT_381380 [Hebeloma cylindrosporum h7]